MGRLIDESKITETFRWDNGYVECNAPTVEAIPKADYEARLKADLVAMLTEIQLEIEENVLADDPNVLLPFLQARETCVTIIQQKINELRARK